MLQHELLRDRGILILKPDGALRAEDFTALAAAVDPYIEQNGKLNGLMIEAPSFPGWENFAALAVSSALRARSSSPDRAHRCGHGQRAACRGAEDREPLRERAGAYFR